MKGPPETSTDSSGEVIDHLVSKSNEDNDALNHATTTDVSSSPLNSATIRGLMGTEVGTGTLGVTQDNDHGDSNIRYSAMKFHDVGTSEEKPTNDSSVSVSRSSTVSSMDLSESSTDAMENTGHRQQDQPIETIETQRTQERESMHMSKTGVLPMTKKTTVLYKRSSSSPSEFSGGAKGERDTQRGHDQTHLHPTSLQAGTMRSTSESSIGSKSGPSQIPALHFVPPKPPRAPRAPHQHVPGAPAAQASNTQLHSQQAGNSKSPPPQDLDFFGVSGEGEHQIVERSPGERYVRFTEKLGSGAYKDVYRAYDTIEGIEVAWNVVKLTGVPKSERNRIVNEVRLLERLHHHNIISFHGSWVNREKEEVIFVTEILSSGTLKNFISKVQVIRWRIAKRWAVQILQGLEYLHSQHPPVIHRDLKCDNIFINGTTGDLRIGDLGLSTAISSSKGKVLSVLGTPEFMAPELYDEAYNEKVDIYAFGMCLLEIFTQEVPYHECSNPAQIYKKVTKGIPPASLKRVRSKDARDFIMLCIGGYNEEGSVSRPSASELLHHPFLAKGADDDFEVEVDPPVWANVIEENPQSSGTHSTASQSNAPPNAQLSTTSDIDGDLSKKGGGHLKISTLKSAHIAPKEVIEEGDHAAHNAELTAESEEEATKMSSQLMHARKPSSGSDHSAPQISNATKDDEADQFDDMPDREVNIKKIKVMMGRGLELEEDENIAHPEPRAVAKTTVSVGSVADTSVDDGAPSQHEQVLRTVTDKFVEKAKPYLVAADVVNAGAEEELQDDILKLMITLPVEGETRNVQFDFHLVKDGAVQVAKEMVRELQIPDEHLLEIGETISTLACEARIKQQEMHARKKNKSKHAASRFLVTGPPLERDLETSSQDAPLFSNPTSSATFTAPGDMMTSTSFESLPSAGVAGMVNGPSIETAPSIFAAAPASSEADSVSLVHGASSDSDDSDEEGDLEELRRAEEEHQKNIQRAMKAFSTRMENLQRSKEHKEAQHLKTLEKHEKEISDFEKRVRQVEAEKQIRLDKLKHEWDMKKEDLLRNKRHRDSSRKQEEENKISRGERHSGGYGALGQRSDSLSPNLDETANTSRDPSGSRMPLPTDVRDRNGTMR